MDDHTDDGSTGDLIEDTPEVSAEHVGVISILSTEKEHTTKVSHEPSVKDGFSHDRGTYSYTGSANG